MRSRLSCFTSGQIIAGSQEAEVHLSEWLLLVTLPTIIYVSLIVAGVGFLAGKSWALPMLAASCIALLLVAARGAWNTLVTIAVATSRQNYSARQQKARNDL